VLALAADLCKRGRWKERWPRLEKARKAIRALTDDPDDLADDPEHVTDSWLEANYGTVADIMQKDSIYS
jgi:hypothetical protein